MCMSFYDRSCYFYIFWYTIVTKNIDLLGNLFTTLQTCFQFIDLTNPFTVDVLLMYASNSGYSIYLE